MLSQFSKFLRKMARYPQALPRHSFALSERPNLKLAVENVIRSLGHLMFQHLIHDVNISALRTELSQLYADIVLAETDLF
jgi:hypothetical protein